jgi:hypothetical protein
MKRVLVAGAILLLLTGCSASSAKTAKPAAPKATYATVTALRDAFVKAGGSCDDWNETDVVTVAAQSGDCSDSTVLSIYVSQTSRDQIVNFAKTSGVAAHLLVGKNWIINTPNPQKYVKNLGGTVVTGG